MITTKTTAIVFDHRGRAKNNERGPLEVRVTMGRKSIYIQTGIKVFRREFVAGRIINCASADRLNDRLTIIYNKVRELHVQKYPYNDFLYQTYEISD